MEPSRAQLRGARQWFLGALALIQLFALLSLRCLLEFEGFLLKIEIFLISQENAPKRSFLERKCEGLGRPEIFSFSKIVFGRVGWHMLSISSQLLVLQVGC